MHDFKILEVGFFLLFLGSPLLNYNPTKMTYTQIGLVSGAIGECGDGRFPTVYVRINHPEIMEFIHSVTSLFPDAGKVLYLSQNKANIFVFILNESYAVIFLVQ